MFDWLASGCMAKAKAVSSHHPKLDKFVKFWLNMCCVLTKCNKIMTERQIVRYNMSVKFGTCQGICFSVECSNLELNGVWITF